MNAQLVLIIEDIDRNISSRFDRQEVLALLHRLKGSDALYFILTGSLAAPDLDFARLCDHIEQLPEIDGERVAAIIVAVRACLKEFPDRNLSGNDDPWRRSP